MFNLPVHFDENEWFILLSMAVLLSAFCWSTRKFSNHITLSLMLFHAVFGLTLDMIIGVSYPWDFYDTMDTNGYDLFDFFIYTINYPIYGWFFAYFMMLWIQQGRAMLTFIGMWLLLTVLLEGVSVKLNVFHYKNGWNLGFSLLAYLFIFSCSAVYLKYMLRHSASRPIP